MSADGAGNVGDRGGRQAGAGPSREGVVDRRVIPDRREIAARKAGNKDSKTGGDNAGGTTGLERRRGPGRRLSDFTRSAEEGEMTQEQFLFLMAIDEFKKANGRTFPSWTDVLEVIRLLGYRKTMPSELKLRSAEDWREQPDTPSNVRPKGWEKRMGMGRDAA
jgi:hypothetical protein